MSDAIIKPGKPSPDAPQSALFVCSMNVIRSPMASAIARTLFPKTIYCRSAGIQAGENDPFVATVMAEAHVDISTHEPHTYLEMEDDHFDVVITLTPEARDYLAEIFKTNAADIEFWPLPDPTLTTGSRAQTLEAYRELRDTLTVKLKQRFGWYL